MEHEEIFKNNKEAMGANGYQAYLIGEIDRLQATGSTRADRICAALLILHMEQLKKLELI